MFGGRVTDYTIQDIPAGQPLPGFSRSQYFNGQPMLTGVNPDTGADTFGERFGASYTNTGFPWTPYNPDLGDQSYLTGGAKSSPAATGPSPLNPFSWKIPSFSDVITGMMNGPKGATKPPEATLSQKIENYFGRGIVVIVGFIFIAVGLYMFSNKNAAVQFVQGVKSGAKDAVKAA